MNGASHSRSSSQATAFQDASSNASNSERDVASKPVGIATQEYAKRVTKLIQLITDLRASGAQAVIDLPRVVVIGNQSAGKSSLVEAISGITVPRAAGTCTRCPMECRLQHSKGPWRCQVLLRYERDEFGNRLPEVKEEKFGPVLHDKSLLEDTLRRAQLAILNPSVQAKRFVDYDLNDEAYPPLKSEKQLQFSCNVVCLDLQSPDVTDLSFIDLPGIISNVAEGEDRNNIDLIKNLVREHIKGNALILLTITMRDDMENQSAAFLAKEADPDGSRTIGALTKPDTLLESEHQQWFDILEGRRHPLTHGYYVTKQPAARDLMAKLDHSAAREQELVFFSSDPYWRNAKSDIRNRMGVQKLTAELSKLLSHLIEATLPNLRDDARQQLSKAKAGLDALPPPPPQHPIAELLRLVSEFSHDVKSSVMGFEGHEALIQECRPVYLQFKKDILSTRPQFSALESKTKAQPDLDDVITRGEGEMPLQSIPSVQNPMYIDQVAEFVQKFMTRQLPYNVPFPAKAALIRECFEFWPEHLQNCFEEIQAAYVSCVEKLVDHHFGRHTNGGLHEYIRMIVEKEFEIVNENMKNRIAWLIRLEQHPYTQNDHYFSSCRDNYLAHFKGRRQNCLIEGEFHIKAVLVNLAEAGLPGVKEEDLPRLLGPDKYEQEMIVMAEVCAYFRVAYKRIIDDLPRIIDFDFLCAFSQNIQQALIDGLGLGGEHSAQRAAAYLSEDPNTVIRRKDLETTKARLEGVLSKLFRFNAA
ncbi:hypothetical protein SCHPADRAFT_857550 [Schizopora paradoxa]|uniref:P-loop containing nucleoside triphosphate hydrolase protein n=1 Tax=Schizopora paradoxa TaxID=27342 RepID=A0A0H2RY89_9AGAM|nr:hypothetical protein SCHPADRAFT_857550 [Schizopora paradoxa]